MKPGQANPGYAEFQLARAFAANENHPDSKVRERARSRIAKWYKVYEGMYSGLLHVGSRTPIAHTPEWATPEVVTGGFATGELLAGGPLLEHERDLLEKLTAFPQSEPRSLINAYYLTDQGLNALDGLLNSGCYRINVPEEGALLVIAWFLQTGHYDKARDLLDVIAPFFNRLRFYPEPLAEPRSYGLLLHVQDISSTIKQLKSTNHNPNILAQREAIQTWIPLYDRLIALFFETVEGDAPWVTGFNNKGALRPSYQIEGGWPCRNFTSDWNSRASALLGEIELARTKHQLCSKPEKQKLSFAQLRSYADTCIKDLQQLTGRDVGRIRLILGRYNRKHGQPGSDKLVSQRDRQIQQVNTYSNQAMCELVISRLKNYPATGGLDDLEPVIEPVKAEEAHEFGITEATEIPGFISEKVSRCQNGTIDELVDRRIVTSSDVLAELAPQVTSEIKSLGIKDPGLRQLYATIYRAFRKRRSLLLLNLESQIRISELPWVAAMEDLRSSDLTQKDLALHTLSELVTLALVAFPHTLIPNKLVQELQALCQASSLKVPLVNEIASDIFMGSFVVTFHNAARFAAILLKDTFYSRYYDIDYSQLLHQMDEVVVEQYENSGCLFPVRRKVAVPRDNLIGICETRAGVRFGGYNTAENGMIIEQQQILTTQNLAPLFYHLNLSAILGDRLYGMAQRCFTWICHRLQIKTRKHHDRLISIKRSAYAWRQMVFYLSLVPHEQLTSFIGWADEHLGKQDQAFQTRFRPAMRGLILVAEGAALNHELPSKPQVRQFLGWTRGSHWLDG